MFQYPLISYNAGRGKTSSEIMHDFYGSDYETGFLIELV